MLFKASLALAAFSALAQQAAAAVIVTDVVVVYTTVYYDPAQATVSAPAAEVQVAPQNAQNQPATPTVIAEVNVAPQDPQARPAASTSVARPVAEVNIAPENPQTQPAKTTLATVVKAAAPKPSAKNNGSSSKSKASTGSKAVASSQSAGSPNFSHKRGLAYNDVNQANNLKCQNCGWGWNWDSNSDGLDSSYNYIPMLWNASGDHLAQWDANAERAINSGSKALLSFNEPDNKGQTNISPELASSLHQQYMNKYQGRALIGTPSISNSGNPGEGLDWLRSFFQACGDNCAVDFCALHWYSDVQYTESLFQHLSAAQEVCGDRKLWLTEFAPNDGTSDQDIITFLNTVIPRLDSLDYLDAYSYFMVDNKLMTANGPSDFGSVYLSL